MTSDVMDVQLANAEVSKTITSTQVENLPVLGRQVSNLYSTQPGINATNDVTSINGLGNSYSSVTIDGVNMQDNFVRPGSRPACKITRSASTRADSR